MIEAGYVRTMARYNAWQNSQLSDILETVPTEVLLEDRGAFFGSILGTLNHLLYGDLLWMSRFDPTMPTLAVDAADHTKMTPTAAVWSAERFRLDGSIRRWADKLRVIDLRGPLTWYSGTLGHDVTRPMAQCVTHVFNHQTHHRGQVHAMLTAAGLSAPVSDLIFMPEEP